MSKQIFRRPVPMNILTSLLEEICLRTDKYYLVDINAYRKLIYNEERCKKFIKDILEYYHSSKQFYVTRDMTYNSFTNIVRQICKVNNVMFSSKIKYIESDYNIDYFVYFSYI